MKIIKNATIFKADLPSTEALAKHIEQAQFSEISPTMTSTSGFVPNRVTGELVTPIAGGFALTLRQDEKILPAASVKAAVDKAAAEAIEAKGELLTDDEFAVVEERTRANLIASALVRTTSITALYYREDSTLVVLTPAKSKAQEFVDRLVQAVGSVETRTINISDIRGGLTTRLKKRLSGDEAAFDGFNLGDSCVLKGDAGKASFDLENLSIAHQGLIEAMEAGMVVERLELEHGTMSFKLAHDFTLRGITYFGELTEDELAERDDFDRAALWRTEAATQLVQLAAAIRALCDLLGYNEERDAPKGEGEQEAEGAADVEV